MEKKIPSFEEYYKKQEMDGVKTNWFLVGVAVSATIVVIALMFAGVI